MLDGILVLVFFFKSFLKKIHLFNLTIVQILEFHINKKVVIEL